MAAPKDPWIHVYLPRKLIEFLDQRAAKEAEEGQRPNRSRALQRILWREQKLESRSGGSDQAPT